MFFCSPCSINIGSEILGTYGKCSDLLAVIDNLTFSRECGCKSGTDFVVAFFSSWFEMFLASLIILIFITGEGMYDVALPFSIYLHHSKFEFSFSRYFK